MFLGRMVFFRLHESPRYLVHAGRPQDAVESLQSISRFNGSDIPIELEDVRDHHAITVEGDLSKYETLSPANSTIAFATNAIPDELISTTGNPRVESAQASQSVIKHYASTGESPNLDSRGNSIPEQDVPSDSPTEHLLKDVALPRNILRSGRQRRDSSASRRSSVYEEKVRRVLPRWLRQPLWAWWDRVMMVLAPEWLRTTILMWSAWFAMALGLSMIMTIVRPH
jgi:hypothetical protein